MTRTGVYVKIFVKHRDTLAQRVSVVDGAIKLPVIVSDIVDELD